jgi:hypothetical protein
MVAVELVYREDDGAAWVEGGIVMINVKWINVEDEAEWYIDESFIHEYVEHILGLGHENAVYVERVLRRMLYRDWYGFCPLRLLYADTASRASSQPGHGAPRLYGQQPLGVQAQP